MSLAGDARSYKSLSLSEINNFHHKLLCPQKMIISASAVNDHKEFEQIVEQTFGDLTNENTFARTPSRYTGGEFRELCETELTYMALVFQGVAWTDKDMVALQILKTAIGEAGSFRIGSNIGKSQNTRAYTSFMNESNFLSGVRCVNMNFSDSGIFGLMISGLNSHTSDMSNQLITEFQNLTSISEQEISRAKNLLKTQMLYLREHTNKRLEDTAKQYLIFKEQIDLLTKIEEVTPDQIRQAASRVIKTKPTLIVLGTPSQMIPNVDTISKRI